ncbi:MAG: hypothetical protein ACYDCL_23045 [Myxococcales bacterium]
MTRALAASLALLAAGCTDVVRSGLPPLVSGCSRDSDCPAPFLCADGGCEEWQCRSSCDCPPPAASYGCTFDGGQDPATGLQLPFFCVPGQPASASCDAGP